MNGGVAALMEGDGYFRSGDRVFVVAVMLWRASWNPPHQHVRELVARPRNPTLGGEARELMAQPRNPTLGSTGTDGSPMEPKPRGQSSCWGHSTASLQNQPLRLAELMA